MSLTKVRVGLVGLGLAASSHIKAYQANSNCEVTAVCDIDVAQAKLIAEQYKIPRIYSSYDEMLKDEEINSVIPDYIEKKIYKNVFTLVLKLVRNITDSTSITFLDQELTITLDPKK